MKKILKVILALAALAGLALGIIIWNLNPILEGLRPQITSVLSKKLGQEVAFAGISAQIIPSVAIELQEVSLKDKGSSEADSSSADKPLEIGAVLLKTSLSDIFSGNISISAFTLKDGSITLTREEDGSIFLGKLLLNSGAKSETPQSIDPPASKPNKSQEQPAESQNSDISFTVEEATLSNLNLLFIDRKVKPEQRILIRDVNLSLDDLSSTTPGKLSGFASLLSDQSKNFGIEGELSLKTTSSGLPEAKLEVSLNKLSLPQLTSLLDAYGLKSKELGLKMANTVDLEASIVSDNNGLAVAPKIIASESEIHFKELFSKPGSQTLTIEAATKPIILKNLPKEKIFLRTASLQLGETNLDFPSAIGLDGESEFQIKAKEIDLAALKPFLPVLNKYSPIGLIKTDLNVAVQPKEKKAAKINLPYVKGTAILEGVGASIPLPSKEPNKDNDSPAKSIKLSGANGQLEFQGDRIVSKALEFKLAGQSFKLGSTINELKAPKVAFSLNSPKLSFDPILDSLAMDSLAPLRGSILANLKIEGNYDSKIRTGKFRFDLGEGSLGGAPIKPGTINSALNDKEIRLQSANIGVFGGALSFEINLKQTKPKQVSAVFNGEEISLHGLLKFFF
ncbi:hypothetical protein BVY02_02595 [bacterium J17]|nr:hypothetical protein BVY02_02595 [bacterium J17]